MTRISSLQMLDTFIANMNKQRLDMEDVRNELSTGIKVSNPSDDPARAGTIEQLRNSLERLDRHKQRMAYATNLLDQQESVLQQARDIMTRAKELATQGANETVGTTLRSGMAVEVFQLRDALVNLANTKINGRYIYGNLDDDDPPVDQTTAYTVPAGTNVANTRYRFDNETGTGTTRSVQISDFTSMQVTTSAGTVFSNAIGSLERLGRALAGYRSTPEDGSAIPDGGGVAFNLPSETSAQTDAIRLSINLIDTAVTNNIENERISVGGRLARIQIEQDLLDTAKLETQKIRSEIQDSDVAAAASRLNSLESAFQGTLSVGARINNLSLLDFL